MFARRYVAVAIRNMSVIPPATRRLTATRAFSHSITYSGGQATDGQGGFYGSGGSRVNKKAVEHHPEALVDIKDIEALSQAMADISELEEQLQQCQAAHGSSINEQSIELKAALNRKVHSKGMSDLLDRLEIHGAPRWGLSTKERSLVYLAREKFSAT